MGLAIVLWNEFGSCLNDKNKIFTVGPETSPVKNHFNKGLNQLTGVRGSVACGVELEASPG